MAARGALALAVVLGVEPLFALVTALPGFAHRAQHAAWRSSRALALALLAGWGLDELSRAGGSRPRAAARRRTGGVLRAAVAGRGRRAPPRAELGAALAVAWGFADRRHRRRTPSSRRSRAQPRCCMWLPLAGAALR